MTLLLLHSKCWSQGAQGDTTWSFQKPFPGDLRVVFICWKATLMWHGWLTVCSLRQTLETLYEKPATECKYMTSQNQKTAQEKIGKPTNVIQPHASGIFGSLMWAIADVSWELGAETNGVLQWYSLSSIHVSFCTGFIRFHIFFKVFVGPFWFFEWCSESWDVTGPFIEDDVDVHGEMIQRSLDA